jgi:oxygen-dependent protoporphyrinogen oxidase
MQRLVDAIAARLPPGSIRLSSPVERIELCRERPPWRSAGPPGGVRNGTEAVPYSPTWNVFSQPGDQPQAFDDVILAAPGAVSSRLLKTVDGDLAKAIGKIECAGCSVAIVGVRRDQLQHPLDGFGFVVPAIEGRKIIAGSMASVKFPGRAPQGKVLLRVFVGGALQPELASLPDDEIRSLVLKELRELLGLKGEPEFCEISRWLGMMPQYHVGHLDLVAQIEERAAAIPHFALAGNAYRGVGVPFCIRSGESAAEHIIQARKEATDRHG